MFPIIAVAGAISAAASVIKGAAWLADQFDSTKAAAADGKTVAKPRTEAKVSPFEAALAAQAAGQSVPGRGADAAPAKNSTPFVMARPANGIDYDSLARMQAGLAAYGHVGDRHGQDPREPSGRGEDAPITRS
jgi:hypothetical protein